MHPYIAYELYRQKLAELDRKAELHRMLPKRESLLRRLSTSLTRLRPQPRPAAGTARQAPACR